MDLCGLSSRRTYLQNRRFVFPPWRLMWMNMTTQRMFFFKGKQIIEKCLVSARITLLLSPRQHVLDTHALAVVRLMLHHLFFYIAATSGRRLYSGSDEGAIFCWNARTGWHAFGAPTQRRCLQKTMKAPCLHCSKRVLYFFRENSIQQSTMTRNWKFASEVHILVLLLICKC